MLVCWILHGTDTEHQLYKQLFQCLPVVISLAFIELLTEHFDLHFEFFGVNFVLVHNLLYLVLVQVLDLDKAVFLLLSPQQFVLQHFNLIR